MQWPFLSFTIKGVVSKEGNAMGNYKDSEMEKVKKSWAGEKEKLSKMNTSQKVDYIWTYYKIHIILIIGILSAIIWSVHHFTTYIKYEFYGMVINGESINEDREKEIHDYLGMDSRHGADLSGGLYSDETVSGGYGTRLSILLMAGECDFAFTDEEGVQYLTDYGLVTDENKAIDISDSPIHEYFGLDDNIDYLVWTGLSGNRDYLDLMMQMMDDIDSGKIK